MRTVATVCAFMTMLFSLTTLAADNELARGKAEKNMRDGNWKDAYKAFSQLVFDAADEPDKVSDDLRNAINCLQKLNRQDESDDFIEKVVAIHAENWKLLASAAQLYAYNQYGYIVGGKFHRGSHRGQGRYVSSFERDRVRSLQLLTQAMEKIKDEQDRRLLSNVYYQFAQTMLQQAAWKLQTLTDLSKLPDFDEVYYHDHDTRGAPVDTEGQPVFYKLPKSFQDAKSDGERWRWLLTQAMEMNPARTSEFRYHFAQFLASQFEVRTMSSYGRIFSGNDADAKDESGPYAVKNLNEDETMARLATGIKRFKLPDEFNHIKIYKQIANNPANHHYADESLQALAQIFEDRQQYAKAAEYWRRAVVSFGDPDGHKQKRVLQIIGNWGMFEPIMTQPAGQGATIDFRYRNGNQVSFKAQSINVPKLLEDIKVYLRAKPKNIDGDKINLNNIGYCLVEKNQTQYLTEQVAAWDLKLKPRDKHFDRRITVTTPLQKAGAYLLTAEMANGNTSRIIIWIADTTLVKKPLDNNTYLYVADAVTGHPVSGAKVDWFGYHQDWNNNNVKIETSELSVNSDDDGQLILGQDKAPNNYNWIITATTPEGRFAYLGFTGVWYGRIHDYEYNLDKIFGITDRPVYRPAQSVKFKVWLNHAKYDQEGLSVFAHQTHLVQITNPKGDKIFEKSFTT
ncbi:MAG: alpha-2-macroglobulin, partial [Planctomycetota bacterium]